MLNRRNAIVSAVLVASLALSGCSPSGSIGALSACVAASEAVVAVLEGTGNIDPATAKQIFAYLDVVSTDVERVSAILATNDATVEKALLIAAAFDNVPGLPPAAQAYVTAVTAAIRAFLAFYPAPTMALRGARPLPVKPLTPGDLANVTKIAGRAALLRARLAAK